MEENLDSTSYNLKWYSPAGDTPHEWADSNTLIGIPNPLGAPALTEGNQSTALQKFLVWCLGDWIEENILLFKD